MDNRRVEIQILFQRSCALFCLNAILYNIINFKLFRIYCIKTKPFQEIKKV